MSGGRKLAVLGAAALVALTLGGCGSGTESADRAKAFQRVLQGVIEQRTGGPPPTVGPEQISAAVRETDQPLLYARFSVTGNSAIMIGIEDNGPYTTFATGARQTITLRDGFLTATRGMGGDLMSVDIDAVRALISARRAGQATRIMRFLNAEDATYEVVLDCRVTPGETRRVEVGAIATTATEVTESCTGRRGRQFTNTYMIDPDGRAVVSSQWGSDLLAQVDLRVLRF
ncbi:YjbF family lipoprotein [Rhodosalinus sp.]|uniref:YjbF family lipoprotein n=1 Tax=Rhodosalinus sp. TaxID=2047741 RepID=UPI00397B197C